MSSSDQFDPRYQTEKIGFANGQLVPCEKCGRANAPNRSKCVYCGTGLAVSSASAETISLRRLETWERGWNVIATRFRPNIDQAKIARIVGLDPEQIFSVITAQVPLPLARAETSGEAEILVDKLTALGVICRSISDEVLEADELPTRLGSIEFNDSNMSVRNFNTREAASFGYDDLAVIVTGELISDRTDVLEKKRRRGGKTKVLDQVQISADEAVIDIYIRSDPRGYRINLAGFDFSCLGDAMSLYASENIRSLVGELRERSRSARLISDYPKISRLLEPVWALESRKDSRGLQRAGFGKVEFASTASTSNLQQFTKYSRLQWHLL